MEVNIDKMRFDADLAIQKMNADIKQANKTFTLQAIGALCAAILAGAAIGHFFW